MASHHRPIAEIAVVDERRAADDRARTAFEECGGPIGFRLAAARKAIGATHETVHAATKIKLTHLAAIEAGDKDALPSTPFTAGFIKSYAQFLGLDADACSKIYREEAGALAALITVIRGPAIVAPVRGPVLDPTPAALPDAAVSAVASPPAPVSLASIIRMPQNASARRVTLASGVGLGVLAILFIATSVLDREATTKPAFTPTIATSLTPPIKATDVAGDAKAATQAAIPAPVAEEDAVDVEPPAPEFASLDAPSRKPARRAAVAARDSRASATEAPTPAAEFEPAQAATRSEPAPAVPPAETAIPAVAEPAITPAKLLKAAPARYPASCAKEAEALESVVVTFDVTTEGRARNVTISKSSNDCFNAAAIRAVGDMRFAPRTLDGAPSVEAGKTATIRFDR